MEVEDVFSGYRSLLKSASTSDTYYANALAESEKMREAGGDFANFSLAMQTDDLVDRLNQLKFRYIELHTKQLFLQRVADSAAREDAVLPCPTMQELATVELAAEQEKAILKKAKDARDVADRRLMSVAADVAALSVQERAARQELSARVEAGSAGARLKAVSDALEHESDEALDALVSRVDEHDTKACNKLLSRLFARLSEAQRRRDDLGVRVGELQHGIDAGVKEQAALEEMLVKYVADAKRLEESNADIPRLREEMRMHAEAYETMARLTLVSLESVKGGGVCLEVSVECPMPRGAMPQGQSGMMREYKVLFDVSESAPGMVTGVALEPADVKVERIASSKRPVPLLEAVLAVRELIAFE